MKQKADRDFALKSERAVKPDEVQLLTTMSRSLSRLPRKLQRKIMNSSKKRELYMGFIVEPYSLFLCHEIVDPGAAEKLIPGEYRLVPVKIFKDDEPKPAVIFSFINVHTSAFWGSRVEMYIIAEHRETKMISWLIVDYESNTASFDPGQGFIRSSSDEAVITTTFDGRILADIPSNSRARGISLSADLSGAETAALDSRLWIEGNLSVAYGANHDNEDNHPFSLIFQPGEMIRAWWVPGKDLFIEENSWFPGLFHDVPFQVVCFPFAQHFVTSSSGPGIRGSEELEEETARLGRSPQPMGLSVKEARAAAAFGRILSAGAPAALGIWLLVHYLIGH